jgi:hypothetical protein
MLQVDMEDMEKFGGGGVSIPAICLDRAVNS